MAQVTRRDITVPTTGVPTIPTPRVQPSAFGAALDVIGGFVRAKNEEVIRTKEVDFQSTSLSSFRTFADKLQGELQPNFGEDLAGYSAAYQEQLQRRIQTIIQDAPTPQSRNVAVSQLSQVMDTFNSRARRDEENAVITAAKIHLEANTNSLINDIFLNPDNVQENLAQMEEMVESAPWIKDKSQGQVFLKAKEEEMWIAYARHFRENDPKELLSDVKEGFYNDKLSNKIISQLKDQADAEIDKNNRKGKAEGRRALRASKRDAIDFIKTTEAGGDWDGDVDTLITALEQNPNREEADDVIQALQGAIEDKGEMTRFTSLTMQERAADINKGAIVGGEPTNVKGIRLQQRKIRSFSQTQSAINKGAMFDIGITQGLVESPVPLNFNDPSTLVDRIDKMNSLREFYGVEGSPLTLGDKAAIKQVMDGSDLNAQVSVLEFLSEMPSGMLRRTANDLSKDSEEFAIALDVVSEDKGAAFSILRGLSISRTEAGKKFAPPDIDLLDTFRKEVGNSMQLSPEHFNAMFQAAKAVYIETVWDDGNASAVADPNTMEEAVEAVTGGMIERDTSWWPGGVTKVLPPRHGMTLDEMDNRLEDPNLYVNLQEGISPETLRDNGIFINSASSKYKIMIGDQVVKNKQGNDFEIDLTEVELDVKPVTFQPLPGRELEITR